MSNRPKKYNKLSERQLEEILTYHISGYNTSKLSRILNVPRMTISDFLNKKTYKDFWAKKGYVTSEKMSKTAKPFVVPKGYKYPLPDISSPEDFGEVFKSLRKVIYTVPEKDLRILVIPDTQVKPESNISHIIAAGKYTLEHKPDVVVIMGDWWDCESLSKFSTNLGKEGKRIKADLLSGKKAMEAFLNEFYGLEEYYPRLVFIVGNHDPQVRIQRLIDEYPNLEGVLEDTITPWLEGKGFEVYPYLDVVNINGIRFSHYFQNPHSAKRAPLSGQTDLMLKNAGFSFVQGHTQTYKYAKHYLGDGTVRIGLVCGAFYQEDEPYMGVQGNHHWRGIVMLNEVKDGGADICEISLKYLLRRYQ